MAARTGKKALERRLMLRSAYVNGQRDALKGALELAEVYERAEMEGSDAAKAFGSVAIALRHKIDLLRDP